MTEREDLLCQADPLQLAESRLDGRVIYDGRILRLEEDTVLLPSGRTATREVVRHPGAVAVVPLTEDGCVICEEQFRYPHGRVLLEIPAGKLDSAEEEPAFAAARELREETGMRAERMIPLGDFLPSPAILSERIWLFLALGLSEGECNRDEDEFLAVRKIPLDRLTDEILAGNVPDGKTAAAVLRVSLMRQRGLL